MSAPSIAESVSRRSDLAGGGARWDWLRLPRMGNGVSMDRQDSVSRLRRRPLLVAAAVAVVLLSALAALLLLRGDGDEETETEPPPRAPAGLASVEDLQALARDADGPVFWAGPRPDMRYELSQTSDGRIYIRYLPSGVDPGDPRGDFLTVGTYPQADALEVVRQRGGAEGAVLRELANGGLAVYNESTPTSVYVAYPRIPRLVEVFHPSAETAQQLAFSGGVIPVVPDEGSGETQGEPVAATEEELREAAAEIGHPVYWLGPRDGFTYELTRLSNGQVYVRYLPDGVEVGDERPDFETVGTYPAEDGLAAAEAAAGDAAGSFDVPGGGRAFSATGTPTNVHFSFPDAEYQVEVFHPEPGRAEELVRGGDVVPIR